YFKSVKEQVSIRFNKVLLAHLRAMGKGWQSKVNDFLMTAYMQGQI
ncbi:MAG: BrnA antitoxin family protein, partial [Treponema sp.]|nr:BrnA antitoxin family protein [Treponema sp.]